MLQLVLFRQPPGDSGEDPLDWLLKCADILLRLVIIYHLLHYQT